MRRASARQHCPKCGCSFSVLEDEQGMHECPRCGYDGRSPSEDDEDLNNEPRCLECGELLCAECGECHRSIDSCSEAEPDCEEDEPVRTREDELADDYDRSRDEGDSDE